MLETTQAVAAKTAEQPIPLTDNARVVLMKRYVRRGPDGKPNESVEEMFHRVARAVAEPDRDHGADAEARRWGARKLASGPSTVSPSFHLRTTRSSATWPCLMCSS